MPNSIGIRKGDTVVIIAGEDGPRAGRSGRRGKVLQVDPDGKRVTVEGVNIVVKHRRGGQQTTAASVQTGRLEMPAPVDRSNLRLVCPRCDEPTRVRYVRNDQNRRIRQCRRCNENVDD